MAEIIPSIILQAQLPPVWISYIRASLVIVTADSFFWFNFQMIQNWLVRLKSDNVTVFIIIFRISSCYLQWSGELLTLLKGSINSK
jgi:hypothetical protein